MKGRKRHLYASQFGDTILSPVIKPMKKKRQVKSHNPNSIYQQWEFNDLTQPSQPIARYQEDSPPPSPPSCLSSPVEQGHKNVFEFPVENTMSGSTNVEQCQIPVVNYEPLSVEQSLDFIPAMITQPDTQESLIETSDKIRMNNVKSKIRTCRMDTNVPKLFSSKSANKKVIKTSKDIKIRLSQEPSETPRKLSKMFRRSKPQKMDKETILREVGLVHKEKSPVSILSKAISQQLSGKMPKKKVRYEEAKESPAPQRREYKAIPLEIVLTKQTIPHVQRQHKPPTIPPIKKLPPLRRKPLRVTKSNSKSNRPKGKTLVSKLKQSKEVVYCADSDDEFKNLSGYEKRQARLKVASIDYSSQLEFKKGVKAVSAMLACSHVSEEFNRVRFEVAVLRKKWGRQTNEQ